MIGDDERTEINRQRGEIVEQLSDWLETPMLIMSFVWLVLFVLEAVKGTSPLLELFSDGIWILFWVEFILKFSLAPNKFDYLKSNWLTALALLLPALRVFRVFRAVRIFRATRAVRGLRLARLITSLNRGMKALGNAFKRRGLAYVLALTMIVLFSGAAGIYSFESVVNDAKLTSYSDALWWTAMLLTSIGSDYFPKSSEGRILCLLLAIYGFAVFGYMTATLASFFLERDVDSAAASSEVKAELAEIRRLILDARSVKELDA